jgi:hypothetical protein
MLKKSIRAGDAQAKAPTPQRPAETKRGSRRVSGL